MGLHARRSQEERGDSLSHIEIKFRNSVLKQITIKLIKKIVEQWIFGFCKWDPGFWGVYWDDERNGQMRSGQFFVTFVIHLQSKLELFILQQNAVLFLTARFFWQVIPHLVAPCEIKIQLFLKFRWHDPIGLWYIISHFYCSNWEAQLKVKSRLEGRRGAQEAVGEVRELNKIFLIQKMLSIVILRCHS